MSKKNFGEKQAKLPLGKFFWVKNFFLKVFLFYKRECDLIMVGGCEDSQRAPKAVQYDQAVNDEMWEMCAESPPNLCNFKQFCMYVRRRPHDPQLRVEVLPELLLYRVHKR